MTDETTNPVDGEAMPEVDDDLLIETDDALESEETTQEEDDAEDQDEGDDDLEDAEWEGAAFKAPKGVKEALMRHADYTRKTQAVAEQTRQVEERNQAVEARERRQNEFAQDIAKLGALDARLAPFQAVQDWPTYLRTGGHEAQAHYAEYQALVTERDRFAHGLGQRVQQRTEQERQEFEKARETGRAELAKHIKGYGPDTLSKMEAFAQPFGFSPEEVRDAETDPRSLRILHLAMVGQQALQQQKKTSTIARTSRAKPVNTLRGTGGRIVARPDTDDFAAFERTIDQRAK